MRIQAEKSRAVPRGTHKTASIMAFAAAALAAFTFALAGAQEARANQVTPGHIAFVDTQAATLWTKPYQARSGVDRPSYTNPTNLSAWEANMTQPQKSWLIGKTQTQALYGNKVKVLDTYGAWAKVAVDGQSSPKNAQGYPGWMPKSQLSTEPGTDIGGRTFAQVESKHALLYDDKALNNVDHSVSFGTRLPITGYAPGKVRVESPTGPDDWVRRSAIETFNPGKVRAKSKPTPAKITNRAAMFRGTPYVWAGASAYGFDCSGFTGQVYRSFGVDIPRDAGDQRNAGRFVNSNNLQKGDLMFFGSSPKNITHVAMVFGNGKIIHAPYNGSQVVIENINSSGLMQDYQGAKRYL